MGNLKFSRKSILIFFIIVITFSGILEYLICSNIQAWMYLVLMWIPALAAIIANYISYKDSRINLSFKTFFRNCGFRKCKIKYILLGIVFPLIYLLIPYAIYWKMHPSDFAYTGVPFLKVLGDLWLVGILGTLMGLLSATGEEIGWRGFLVPSLYERLGLNKSLIISSLVWCTWHLPILIWGDYMSGTALLYQIPAFILCIFPVGIIAGLLAIRSKSLWPAAFLHAAHNNYDQSIFSIITRGDDMMYYVSETGIYTIVCAWILAIIFYIISKKKIANEIDN